MSSLALLMLEVVSAGAAGRCRAPAAGLLQQGSVPPPWQQKSFSGFDRCARTEGEDGPSVGMGHGVGEKWGSGLGMG